MAITFTNNLDLKLNRITNVGAPAVSSDAVTKQYVDNIATGLIWKDAVRVASETNVNINSPGTIDGVTLVSGDRVLLMGQTTASANGIYAYDGSKLVRATDADQNSELRSGTAVTVTEGTLDGNKTFVLVTDGPITVGTTALNWSLLNAGTSPVYTEGDGIDVVNNVISAQAATSGGIAVGASGISAVADPAGGIQVGTNGIATKLVPNSALSADATGLKFVPKTAGGLTTDSGGASIVVKPNAGIAVDATGVQTVVASNKGLTVDANGLAVVSGNGIATDATGVKAVADPAGGLAVSSAGVAAKLPTTSGLKVDSNGLAVVAKTAGGLLVDAGGVSVVAKPNTGITVDGTGVGLNVRTNDGLDVDGTGLGITTDPAGGLQTAAAGLSIKPYAAKGITVDANGISATLNPNGGVIVDAQGLAVKAGPGIIVDSTGVHIDTSMVTRKFAATVGDGTATSIAVTHNLNTRDVKVELYSTAAPYDTVYAEVQRTDVNTVTLLFGTAPTSGQYRAVVTG